MKKSIVMFALVSFALVFKATGEMNYVSVDGATYFSDDVKIGLTNVLITTENGLTLKAPLKKVNAYMVDGKLYERLQVICPKGNVKGTALMEFITQRNGLRLYKYKSFNDYDNQNCRFLDKSLLEATYFIYKDGQFYLRVNEKNAETVFPFFHVKFNS